MRSRRDGRPSDLRIGIALSCWRQDELLHAEHGHVGSTAQGAGGVVPELDLAQASLPGAAQIDDAALAVFGNAEAHVDVVRRAVVVGDDQPVDVERRVGDLELDPAEVVVRSANDDPGRLSRVPSASICFSTCRAPSGEGRRKGKRYAIAGSREADSVRVLGTRRAQATGCRGRCNAA
jgi:hypothetical protein